MITANDKFKQALKGDTAKEKLQARDRRKYKQPAPANHPWRQYQLAARNGKN